MCLPAFNSSTLTTRPPYPLYVSAYTYLFIYLSNLPTPTVTERCPNRCSWQVITRTPNRRCQTWCGRWASTQWTGATCLPRGTSKMCRSASCPRGSGPWRSCLASLSFSGFSPFSRKRIFSCLVYILVWGNCKAYSILSSAQSVVIFLIVRLYRMRLLTISM